jgi:predicted O-methyltransferase YrrM
MITQAPITRNQRPSKHHPVIKAKSLLAIIISAIVRSCIKTPTSNHHGAKPVKKRHPMPITLPIDIDQVKGFLAEDEAEALYHYALKQSTKGPVLEIGSYCGKSAIYLGSACKETNSTLYALDHHRGSEEHQLGEEYHDADLYDQQIGLFDSFKAFRNNIRTADLEQTVVPIVTSSAVAAKSWATPLAMVFIDGGHSMEAAQTDYQCWAKHIIAGGVLAIHDLFPNPDEGGQAPITIYRQALASGLFEEIEVVNTLGLLHRR